MPHRRQSRQLVTVLLLVSLLGLSACSGSGSSGDAEGPASPSSTSPTVPLSPTAPPSSGAAPSEVPGDAGGAGAPASLVRSTFFGMHDGRVTQGAAPDVPVGALRFWDTGTSWRDLETSPGQFTWGPLDTAVATAEAAHARPLLVLGQTPEFHASKPGQEAAYGPGAASMPDVDAWRRYLTAVAQRYGDRIDYQVWNETNVVGYWTGTPKQMAELTLVASRVIHQVAPKAIVVAPAFALRLSSQQGYFARFWSQQSAATDLASAVDAAAVHLYPLAEDPPEAEVTLFAYAQKVLTKYGIELPVWNTEINFGLLGGVEPPAISPERQRAFVMRNYLLNAGLGVQRVYWYRWDLAPIANTRLTTPDYSAPTLAGRVLATLGDWLVGTRVQQCEATKGVWECTATKGEETRTFWWKPRGPATRLPAVKSARSWTDADEKVTPCRGGCEVPVGETPVMVTS